MVTRLAVLVLVLQAGVLALEPEASVHLTANSKYAHGKALLSSTVKWNKILCQADVPITGCHFGDPDLEEDIDLDEHGAKETFKQKYFGTGFADGQCGLEFLENGEDDSEIVGCRVSTEKGGWRNGEILLQYVDASGNHSYQLNLEGELVVLPGSDVYVTGRSDQALDSCSFLWQGQEFWVHANGGHNGKCQVETTWEEPQCGFTISNVRHSGFLVSQSVSSAVPHTNGSDFLTIIVAVSPDPPIITTDKTYYHDGDVLHATCVISDSSPVSNITWYWGDQVIRNDSIDETPDGARWRWSHEPQVITQNITRTLSHADNGVKLRCEANHWALPDDKMESSFKIIVFNNVEAASQFDLTIQPRCLRVKDGKSAKIMAQADVPITECQFMYHEGDRVDLTEEDLADPDVYYGTGLKDGQCGIDDLRTEGPGSWGLLSFRARTENSPWVYAETMLHIDTDDDPLLYAFERESAIVEYGGNVTLVARSDRVLSSCIYQWPGQDESVFFDEGEDSNRTERYAYHGKGLGEGWCGVTLFNVTESGMVVSKVYTDGDERTPAITFMTLIVSTPPSPVSLRTNGVEFSEGDELEASCKIKRSRPVANITWYLDDELLRQDAVDESPREERWRWSYEEQSIIQRVSRKLGCADDDRELRCVAGHSTLPQGTIEARVRVKVKCNRVP